MISNRHSAIESNNAFTAKVEDLIKEIVTQNNILYYRIESSVEHLANGDGEDNFMPVIRVITYFEDTVSQISDLLSNEFEIVAENSVDKKKSQIESFSYKHIQFLVGLKANRRELIEYKRSGDKKFEIQICSMLQDAWAGIEKELGYDSATFPEAGKRDLYRVGALLEMADLEFLKIRSKFINQPVAYQRPEPIYTPAAPVAAEETYIAPAPEPQPEMKVEEAAPAYIEPEHEVIVNDIVEEPVAVHEEEIYEEEVIAAPVAEEPVYIAPAPIIEEPVYVAPVIEQPVYIALAPVARPEPVVINVAPTPAPTPVPAPAPAGLAPKRTKIEIAATIAAAAVPIIEPVISTPEKVIEHLKTIVEERVPEIADIAPVIEAAPQVQPVEQPVFKAAENLAATNGHVETTPEVVGEPASMPFFEDILDGEPAKTVNKPLVLDENAPITDASLKEYVLKSKLLKEIDKQIAERAGAKINGEIDIEGDVERLRFLKVYTLKQLHDRLKDNQEDIVAFAEKWIGKDNGGSFDSGISLFYLEYLLVGKKNDPAFAVEYVVKFISDNDYSARYIIPTYNSVRSTEAPNFSHLTLK